MANGYEETDGANAETEGIEDVQYSELLKVTVTPEVKQRFLKAARGANLKPFEFHRNLLLAGLESVTSDLS